jgi:Nickel responsive protein SCO4226-like
MRDPGAGHTVARMPRFIVERSFPGGLAIAANEPGARLWLEVVARNRDEGVTWIHSYVSQDRRRTFEVYDGPSSDAIRRAAERSGLPVKRITPVMVLDPYSYR